MFPLLLLLWFLFAGSFSLTNLLIGCVVCALVTLLSSRFLGYSSRHFYGSLNRTARVLLYVLNLLKEIFVSNWNVLKVIWGKKQPEAMLVRFRSSLKSEGLQVLAANSITLTPGTFTVSLKDGEYVVHALDRSFAEGIENCCFFEQAAKLED